MTLLATPATAGAPPDLEPIRRRLAAATPGPWTHETSHPTMTTVTAGCWPVAIVGTSPEDLTTEWEDEYLAVVQASWAAPSTHDDAELIAHAPEDLATLLAEVDRLHDALTKIHHMVEGTDGTRAGDLRDKVRTVLEDAL